MHDMRAPGTVLMSYRTHITIGPCYYWLKMAWTRGSTNVQTADGFKPVPPSCRYPWERLKLPHLPSYNHIDACRVAMELKTLGNESFLKGDYYDALWKYEHSLLVLTEFRELDKVKPAVHCNIAASCLRLGDDDRVDLLFRNEEYPTVVHQIMWYGFSHQHAHEALIAKPGPKIAHKAYYRRAESFRKMLTFSGMRQAMESFLPAFPTSDPYHEIVRDYLTCCSLQEDPNPKIFYEALVLAVDHDQTGLVKPLVKSHVRSGFTSNLLKEAFSDSTLSPEIIEYILLEMEIHSSITPHFNASSLSATVLLKRGIHNIKVYKKLIGFGMTILPADIKEAVRLLPSGKLVLFEILVLACSWEDKELFAKVCESADKLNKRQFLSILQDSSKNSYEKFKEEGNSLFTKRRYEDALGKYFMAINYCKKHNMTKEVALIRANCAQACIKLQLYSDAFAHCCECVKLDPENHKGYYRKAESLKVLLQSSRDYGHHMDVVMAYLKCHSLQENVDACSQAVVLAVEHECTYLIPKLQRSHVKSGFSSECLKYIMNKATISIGLLKFLFTGFVERISSLQPYDASFMHLAGILKETTDPFIIKSFMKCGAIVDKKDIREAAIFIPDSRADLFEFIFSTSKFEDDLLHSGINLACHEALLAKKKNIVTVLVKNGSTPPPAEVLQIMRFDDNPYIQNYLSTVAMTNAASEARAASDVGKQQFDLPGAKEHIRLLNGEAKVYFENGDYEDAAQCYVNALRDCEAHCLVKEAGTIHSSLSHLFLQTREYFRAYEHASTCIRMDREHAKGYFRRAESLKLALKSGKNHNFTRDLSYSNCIDDYKESYKKKNELKTLTEALILAGEIGKLKSLSHECRQLPQSLRAKLLSNIISYTKYRPSYNSVLSYLMVEIWKPKSVDCSKISLQELLVVKQVSSPKLLRSFLLSGVSVHGADIKAAILQLPMGEIESLKLLTSNCTEYDVNEMCSESSKAKKISFVFHFVELGAELPEDSAILFTEALKIKNFEAAKSLVKLLNEEAISKLDLASLLETNLILNQELIELLIEAGVNLNKKKSVLGTVLSLHHLSHEDKIDILCLLINGGADCNQLCPRVSTPVHVATDFAIKSNGVTKLIDAVLASPTFNRSSKPTNEKSETPIHLAAKPHIKKEISIPILTVLLEAGLYNPSAKDKSKKRAIDYIHGKDSPLKKMLEEAQKKFKPDSSKKKRAKNSDRSVMSHESKAANHSTQSGTKSSPSQEQSEHRSSEESESKLPEAKELIYSRMSLMEKISFHVDRVISMEKSYFQEVSRRENSAVRDTEYEAETVIKFPSPVKSRPKIDLSPSLGPSSGDSHNSMLESPLSTNASELGLDKFNFDGLPWEVEITRNVIEFFKNKKKHSPTDRFSAARVIHSIAEGKRNEHLSKPVSSNQKVSLYEARITQAARILWERAISYSSKLTGQGVDPVYTQVIRIWGVILDHDDLDRAIRDCSQKIELSYKRGFMASIRWALKQSIRANPSCKLGEIRGREMMETPCIYTIQNPYSAKSEHEFVPAASTNTREYNVTTFYSFDTMTVKSMIAGTNDRRDYPFKEWQKEHEIIKISSPEAILLLGRSGTGKTTCCLYRLWNEFKNFWNPQSKTYGWKLPRRALISSASLELSGDEDDDSARSSDDESGSDRDDDVFVNQEPNGKTISIEHPIHSTYSEVDVESAMLYDRSKETIEENLHQIFVTKNYVLCDQMKKRFYSMAAAYDFMEPHLPFEESPLPSDFTSLDDLAYPAFLTARQFYIILDNSLGDSGCTFFKRDGEGNLQVRISSLDYDHEDPDVLLDFESSDSETDDIPDESPVLSNQKPHLEKWTEVTALYFKNVIWPRISHQCGVTIKGFDPMLVWIEIQSFIKGSELAIRKGRHLSFSEYKEVGNRMAPNFTSHREVIYKLFKKYHRYTQNLRHSNVLFDECDLIIHIHQRLKRTKDVPWSIHSLYIDEVQDFTQAELAVFIHCCRDPNSMFFTGDTAQSIMRGVAFRFQDLRSCFHRINSKVPAVNVPQKPHCLNINYRSHAGILKLAGSIIDIISEFFKDSIDHLPEDEGMFPGPVPIFLDSCMEADLSLLLSTNKRECSAIEFGAHQVIIVQSKEAKDRLPSILKGAIVLTVFEAKGLEFDDVLLYNFFTDSMVDEKGWRVVTSYLEMGHNVSKIKNESRLPGSNVDARSKKFDPILHKSLNAELKYLYTAVTRAKCNLWIYDSNEKIRLPMLQYWHMRDAVKVVAAHSGSGEESYSFVFASNSTSEQWKAQGDNFKKKHLWEQALLCYERAGPEHSHLVKEAQAYFHIQSAQQQNPQSFQSAALSFLERDELNRSVHCLKGAALCLKNSKPPRYSFAASLYEKLGDLYKAAQSYLRARDLDNFARIQESRGEYNSVIRSLHGKPFMRKRDALSKSAEYEKKGYELDKKFTASELSFSCAKFYSERKDKMTLLEVLQYMPEHDKRVKFMKEAELFEEAFKDYVSNDHYSGAYRLALAHGWYDKAIGLAKEDGDEYTRALFVVQKAKSYLNSSPKSEMDKDLVAMVRSATSSKDKVLQAEASLLLGMLLKSQGQFAEALSKFKVHKHRAGILEAFNQFNKASNQEILDCCHHAKRLSKSLRSRIDMNIDVKETMKFCGLQHIGKVYLASVFFWVEKDALMKYQCEDDGRDIDGMIRLKDNITEVVMDHYEGFIPQWLERFGLESKLYGSFQTFNLHPQLWRERSLTRQYSLQEVSSLSMKEYLQACVHVLELRLLKDESTAALIALILAIFSPQVSMYLPKCLNEEHVQTVRRSVNSLYSFKNWIDTGIIKPSKSSPDSVSVNQWLFSWRASCIALPSMKFLLEKIGDLEKDVNNAAKNDPGKFVIPAGYIYWKSEECYRHIFMLWLNSCIEIREHARPLWAAKLAITHFIGNIAEDKRITISVLNCVDVLSIHCTSLLAIITHLNALQNISTTFTVPLLYKHITQLFSHMICRRGGTDKSLLKTCVEEAASHNNLRGLFTDCKLLLIRAMGYLVGTHKRAPWFSTLKFGLQKFPKKDATRYCLILTLTLFGNLAMLRVKELKMFEEKIVSILKRAVTKNEDVPEYVREVYKSYLNNSIQFSHPSNIFGLVEYMLKNSKMDSTMSKLVFRRKVGHQGHIDFMDFSTQQGGVTPPIPSNAASPSMKTEALPQHNHLMPTSSESRAAIPPSSIPAPIGSERGQLQSGNSGLPTPSMHGGLSPEVSLNPHATPYLPGFPSSSVGDHIQHMQPNLLSNLQAPYQDMQYFPNSSPSNEDFHGQAMFPVSHDQATIAHGYYFNFIEESSYSELNPDKNMEEEEFHGEEMNFVLIQQERPIIDPDFISEDVIDHQNDFCNACGITYIKDDIEPEEYELNRPNAESFYYHVSGKLHADNTIAFKHFMHIISKEYRSCTDVAEEKLEEWNSLKIGAESEQFDRAMDNLREQIRKYNLAVAEHKESRDWRSGINEISKVNEQMDRVLKDANDQHQKLVTLKQGQLLMKERDLDSEDDEEEIEKLSSEKDSELESARNPTMHEKVRSAEEKQRSRQRKKGKKK